MKHPLIHAAAITSLLAPSSAQSFSNENIVHTSTSPKRCIAVSDLDGDGDLDVVSGSEDHELAWYQNFGTGVFGPQRLVTDQWGPIWSVSTADFDQDGDKDILSLFKDTDRIEVYENNGLGDFNSSQVAGCGVNGPVCGNITDMNLDGDPDVVVAIYYGNGTPPGEVAVLTGGAGLWLGCGAEWETATSPFAIIAADINNDTALDLVTASVGEGGRIDYLIKENTGQFSDYTLLNSDVVDPTDLVACDLNLDGYVDILSTSLGKLTWYENLGGTGFGPQNLLDTGGWFQSVLTADIDLDGDDDVLAASTSTISWYENLGGGTFGPPIQISAPGTGATDLCLGDIDGDNDLDVIATSRLSGKISWYENVSCDYDCNLNGVADCLDISTGTSTDCDSDGSPDECTFNSGAGDCNLNGVYDPCEIISGSLSDCNTNWSPDFCEALPDCDSNGTPDECEADCNRNGIPDTCENGNDCNADGIPDDCETNNDCNTDGVPDDCEPNNDCNNNGTPDDCEVDNDCNLNGAPDDCDISNGTDTDFNANAIPDSCECIVSSYCPASDNSTGLPVTLNVINPPSVSFNQFGINAQNGPPAQPGLFFFGQGLTSQPFGEGIRCVSTPIIRVGPPVFFNGAGTTSKQLDMNATALSNIQPADTRYFQLWYRDTQGGPFGFNLSNGLEITFCP